MRHTSASLTIQENADPDVLRDLADALDKLAPRGTRYRHSMEGADDMPGHIRSMLTAVSLGVPVAGGEAVLGVWQAIYLIEHRDQPARPRDRPALRRHAPASASVRHARDRAPIVSGTQGYAPKAGQGLPFCHKPTRNPLTQRINACPNFSSRIAEHRHHAGLAIVTRRTT